MTTETDAPERVTAPAAANPADLDRELDPASGELDADRAVDPGRDAQPDPDPDPDPDRDAATDLERDVQSGLDLDVQSGLDRDAQRLGRDAEPDLDRVLEAILMVADEPQSIMSLATGVGRPVAEVGAAVARLVADFDGEGGGIRRGFELREVGGGWRIYVRSVFDEVVRDFVHTQNPSKLSQAALETLAVIAYKQPISRGSIASIRAVNVDSVVRTLLGRGLITEAFTDGDTGAIHYATTDLMLQQLGVNSIDELPPISPLLDDGAGGFDE